MSSISPASARYIHKPCTRGIERFYVESWILGPVDLYPSVCEGCRWNGSLSEVGCSSQNHDEADYTLARPWLKR
jgi:hypothetical protein